MIEVGKNYYVIAHAYHHYLGKCVAIHGKTLTLSPCFKVHSSELDWEKFLDDKTTVTRNNTRLHRVPTTRVEGIVQDFAKELPQ